MKIENKCFFWWGAKKWLLLRKSKKKENRSNIKKTKRKEEELTQNQLERTENRKFHYPRRALGFFERN